MLGNYWRYDPQSQQNTVEFEAALWRRRGGWRPVSEGPARVWRCPHCLKDFDATMVTSWPLEKLVAKHEATCTKAPAKGVNGPGGAA